MSYRITLIAICLLIGGCSGQNMQQESYIQHIQSQKQFYYQQNVVRPDGSEPDVTPYGPPANATTAAEYDRWIRPDAVSHYPGLE